MHLFSIVVRTHAHSTTTAVMGLRQVKDDFCEFFIDRAGERGSGGAAAGALTVSLEGFREYYRDVGVCEPYDTVFVPTIEVGMLETMRYLALWGR